MPPVVPKQILISGWYGHGNVGDEALLRVFCRELRRRVAVEITVLSEHPKGVLASHPDLGLKSVRHYPLFGWEGIQRLLRGQHRDLFRALSEADLFVLGGGSILRDNTTWKNFLRVIDEFWLSAWYKVPTALYAVGVGPFRSVHGKRMAGKAVLAAKVLTVRDAASRDHLVDTGIAADRVQVVTDPAFLLPIEEVSLADLGPEIRELIESGRPFACVYPTQLPELSDGGLSREEAFAEIAAGLDRLAEEQGLAMVFVPFQYNRIHNDIRIANRIIRHMAHRDQTLVLGKPLPPEESKYLTTLPLLNICIRLHAFIFAASLGRPVVAIDYEPKVRNNARLFGVEHSVAAIEPGLGDAIFDRALAALEGRAATIAPERLEELRRQAELPFDRIAAVLKGE